MYVFITCGGRKNFQQAGRAGFDTGRQEDRRAEVDLLEENRAPEPPSFLSHSASLYFLHCMLAASRGDKRDE
jgi:hypothetical protein